MSSSTFSSKSEWKVWAVVLTVLVTAEVLLRGLLPHLSQDIVHIQQIPQSIESLSNYQGTRVLFLGNSITRNGIDLQQFERQLKGSRPTMVEAIYPDDTAIVEWLYAYIHFLELPEKKVDELIIGFAEDQLLDRPTIDVRRLAANYSDWSTMLTTFQQEDLSLGQQAEFVLARLWVSFANAERVQKRLLDYLIPYYRQTAGRINASLAMPANHKGNSVSHTPTYRRFQRLLGLLKDRNVNLIVLAFPVGEDYQLDPGLEHVLQTYKIPLTDVRSLPGIGPENFPDGYHMDHQAAQIMTTAVAKQVSKRLDGE